MVIVLTPNRFRWVFCQLEALRYCFPPSVRHMLEKLPETLDETYERILREINKANRDHAHRLLQCLTVAVRPLRIAELAEILAVDFMMVTHAGTSNLNADWRWEDQEQAVLSTCSSLIAVVDDHGSQIVQFSHYSVKEFLTSSRLACSSADVSQFYTQLEPAHTILAKACMGTLLQLGRDDDGPSVQDRFPLANYAATHWADHAQFENVASQIQEEMEILFDQDKPYFSAWLQVDDIDRRPVTNKGLFYFAEKSNTATPLYYAALCGFQSLAEQLIVQYPQHVNANGGHCVSPLVVALDRGHFKVAELLYQHGANVDVLGWYERTPLYAISGMGLFETVQWLLSHGADPNVQDGHPSQVGSTPLHMAAGCGCLEETRILLQYRANYDARDAGHQTPLHHAASEGRPNVARLLLEHDVDVNAQDTTGSTPLHLASGNGTLEVVRLLVEHGADIDAEDNNGMTALQIALAQPEGYHEVIKFLSEHSSKQENVVLS